jgi:hypothetical protein
MTIRNADGSTWSWKHAAGGVATLLTTSTFIFEAYGMSVRSAAATACASVAGGALVWFWLYRLARKNGAVVRLPTIRVPANNSRARFLIWAIRRQG